MASNALSNILVETLMLKMHAALARHTRSNGIRLVECVAGMIDAFDGWEANDDVKKVPDDVPVSDPEPDATKHKKLLETVAKLARESTYVQQTMKALSEQVKEVLVHPTCASACFPCANVCPLSGVPPKDTCHRSSLGE